MEVCLVVVLDNQLAMHGRKGTALPATGKVALIVDKRKMSNQLFVSLSAFPATLEAAVGAHVCVHLFQVTF